MQNTVLESIALNSSESISLYKKSVAFIDDNNPYYCYELLDNHLENQELYFFLYKIENEASVVMPFIFRKIILNNIETGYYDITSPWGYNGPLFNQSLSKELIEGFWLSVDNWYKDNNVISEFLRFNFNENYTYYSGTSIHTLRNVKGKIADWDYFWSNLKSNTRNQFRKAKKEGLTFELHFDNIDPAKVKAFYDVYIGTMNRRDAIDSFYHPLEYFTEFCNQNPSKCAIGLVYEKDLPISCELFLISNDTMFSFLGGTSADHFKLRPNEYLKISAIDWAKTQGLTYYMIGGGLSNSETDNLYLYKKKYFPFDDDIHFYTGRKIIDSTVYAELVKKASSENNTPSQATQIEEGFFPRYRE